jgi:hypothetical protein
MTKQEFTNKWLGTTTDKATEEFRNDMKNDLQRIIEMHNYQNRGTSIEAVVETPIQHAFAKSERRFYAACMAMQGILANVTGIYVKDVVELSYRLADAMIEEESKTLKTE